MAWHRQRKLETRLFSTARSRFVRVGMVEDMLLEVSLVSLSYR